MGEQQQPEGDGVRPFWQYERDTIRLAWEESSGALREHMKIAVAAALAVIIAGGVLGVLGDLGGSDATSAFKGAGGALLLELLTCAVLYCINLVAMPSKIHAADQTAVAQLREQNDQLRKASGDPDGIVKTAARHAYEGLIRAKMRLPGVSSAGDAEPAVRWQDLEEALEKYRIAYKALRQPAHAEHNRIYRDALDGYLRRDADAVSDALWDLMEIMILGECDLNVYMSNVVAVPFRSSRKGRRHFAVVNLCITNREDHAVALLPNWHLTVRQGPGFMSTMSYDVDAEVLEEWEQQRKEYPLPATPWLPVPLHLKPSQSAVGYWSFLLPRLRSFIPDADKKPGAHLDILDTVSQRRAKNNAGVFNIEPLLASDESASPQS